MPRRSPAVIGIRTPVACVMWPAPVPSAITGKATSGPTFKKGEAGDEPNGPDHQGCRGTSGPHPE